MITLEHVVAMAIKDPMVLDQLGEALRSDLVLANPFYRRIAGFADDFVLHHRKLPAPGDWDLWLESLDSGTMRDGTREALGRLLATNLSTFTPAYFATQALEQLKQAAVTVARTRLNEATNVTPETFMALAKQIDSIQGGGIQGLAHLKDLDVWVHPLREDDLIPTGYPGLDKEIGGWGKELWMLFADTGIGKSMFLQNALAHVARKGKRGLHITLELGLRSQIHRYYRQLAQATRSEFTTDTKEVKRRLRHWFRFAQGEIVMLEFPAYSLDPDTLKRTIERVARAVGDIDVLALDYLDLMSVNPHAATQRGYENLGRITHEVRGLCPAFDITVLTASQAVRKPQNADRLTKRDMGDGYSKVRGVDGLLSLNQTEEELEQHQGRLGILKVRDSGGMGKEIPLYINRELALIQDLDHPNTIELMKRLKHGGLDHDLSSPSVGLITQ